MSSGTAGDAFDLLEEEACALGALLRDCEVSRAPGFDEQVAHGIQHKLLVRHLGVREAAKVDIAL
ncbi:MAG: hypothetical protein ACYCVN_08065 [Acidimicrobiales bacterium]